jgi:hypothetical protein
VTDHLPLGFDVGTTTSEAVVLTVDGVERSSGVAPTPWKRVPTGAEALLPTPARPATRRAAPTHNRVSAADTPVVG